MSELKLASGISSPGRLQDLADVQKLIQTIELSADFRQHLHPLVREKYAGLWALVHDSPES